MVCIKKSAKLGGIQGFTEQPRGCIPHFCSDHSFQRSQRWGWIIDFFDAKLPEQNTRRAEFDDCTRIMEAEQIKDTADYFISDRNISDRRRQNMMTSLRMIGTKKMVASFPSLSLFIVLWKNLDVEAESFEKFQSPRMSSTNHASLFHSV